MKRSIGILLVLVGAAFPLGCGGKADSDGNGNISAKNSSTPTVANGVSVPPNEIVAMFSDSIRRGDKETTIKLITLAAREEIQRRGVVIDPPGSPDASYKIGEVKFLDNDRETAYVESVWIEPGVAGQPNQQTEVVWQVHKEPEGWRISGLAIDMGPDQQPTLVDFEDLEVNTIENPTSASTGNVASNPGTSNPGTLGAGFQTPPASQPGNNATTPSPNGFTMPELAAPQISQPPNTQFR